MEVSIGDLEETPNRYTGKMITVTAEVEDVFGPHLFKIDEANWGDMDGEVLVHLPSHLAALVHEDDRVTITGTMKMLIAADIERELGWLDPDPETQITFAQRPVLEAVSIVGGNSNVALAIDVAPTANSGTLSTSGTSATAGATGAGTAALTDVAEVARGDRTLVGRQVRLSNARVGRVSAAHGFWVESGGSSLFVLPAAQVKAKMPAVGQSVSLEGLALEMPRSLRDTARADLNSNEDIYVYATTVK